MRPSVPLLWGVGDVVSGGGGRAGWWEVVAGRPCHSVVPRRLALWRFCVKCHLAQHVILVVFLIGAVVLFTILVWLPIH